MIVFYGDVLEGLYVAYYNVEKELVVEYYNTAEDRWKISSYNMMARSMNDLRKLWQFCGDIIHDDGEA